MLGLFNPWFFKLHSWHGRAWTFAFPLFEGFLQNRLVFCVRWSFSIQSHKTKAFCRECECWNKPDQPGGKRAWMADTAQAVRDLFWERHFTGWGGRAVTMLQLLSAAQVATKHVKMKSLSLASSAWAVCRSAMRNGMHLNRINLEMWKASLVIGAQPRESLCNYLDLQIHRSLFEQSNGSALISQLVS